MKSLNNPIERKRENDKKKMKKKKLTRFAKPSFIIIVVVVVIEGQEVNKLGCVEVFVEFINSEVPF
jgi:hypothetical protein